MSNRYPLFWLKGNNFGDMLGPWLYEHITGRKPTFSNKSPRILSCGSILGRAVDSDIVWGSGFLDRPKQPRPKGIRIRYVRGPLSAEILRKQGHVVPRLYGDPGLLVHRYMHKPDVRYDVGYVPHYADAGMDVNLPPDSIRIHPMKPVPYVLERLAACRGVVSSSLHGIVVAESLGISAVWVRISNSVPKFKFRDYYLGTGRKVPKPMDWRDGVDWKAVLAAFDRWTPPQYSEEDLLACCPFDLERNKS